MRRREFLGAALGAAVSASCVVRPRQAGHRVNLAEVDRLIVERYEPLAGRCRYVAETAAGRVAQPLLVARRGERCTATIVNALPQPTTVHFHGLALPEAQDGAGFEHLPPGASKKLAFDVLNRAGLYWFHPHAHGFTAEQVHAGLVGLLVVSDEDDEALDQALSITGGNRLALAIADVRVSNGSIRPYQPSDEECLHGWLGNRVLVNGAMDFRAAVAPGWVRLQLLNACNARGLLLAFRHAGGALVPFYVLGTDGGLLAAPVEVPSAFLHSGERLDVAVPAERSLEAVSLLFDPRQHVPGKAPRHVHALRHGYPPLAGEGLCGPGGGSAALHDGAELSLFRLDVHGPAHLMKALPSRLSSLAEADFASAPVRRMRLDFDEKSGFLIDQTPYRRDEVAFSVPRGSRELWEVRNSPISMPHPMHLHGFGFRVLRRQGTFGSARRLAAHGAGRLSTDLGVKDTVTLWPNETVWLGVDYSLPAGPAFAGRQRYMFHCHNLEHEDGMMMRNFEVT